MWVQVGLRHDRYDDCKIAPDCTWEFHDSDEEGKPGIIHFFYGGKSYRVKGFRSEGKTTLYGYLISEGLNALYHHKDKWPEELPKCWVSLYDLDLGSDNPAIYFEKVPKVERIIDTAFYEKMEEFGVF